MAGDWKELQQLRHHAVQAVDALFCVKVLTAARRRSCLIPASSHDKPSATAALRRLQDVNPSSANYKSGVPSAKSWYRIPPSTIPGSSGSDRDNREAITAA